MKFASLCLTVLLVLSILAPPAEAQRRRRRNRSNLIAPAVALGVIGAIAASRSNRGYYGNNYYGRGYGGYNSGYGYGGYRPYGYRTYGTSYVAPGALPFGATTFVDEGAYRNYRDAYGNYLGRVPLAQLY